MPIWAVRRTIAARSLTMGGPPSIIVEQSDVVFLPEFVVSPAVFHLADELQYRIDLAHLPNSDYRSLAVTQDERIERSTQSVEICGAPLESVSYTHLTLPTKRI